MLWLPYSPTYPSDSAAIQFDRSGTTRIAASSQPQLHSAGFDWRERLLRLWLIRRNVRIPVMVKRAPPVMRGARLRARP